MRSLATRLPACAQPEMSHNVQKYDKQVYLRVSEAQRCRVHSTLVMPLFGAASAGPGARPVAVFELVQADRDVAFPAVMAELRKCLNVSTAAGWELQGCSAVLGCSSSASCRRIRGAAIFTGFWLPRLAVKQSCCLLHCFATWSGRLCCTAQ